MLSAQSPISINQIQRGRSERKALQPKNSAAPPIAIDLKTKSENASGRCVQPDTSNKENVHPLHLYATPSAAKIEPPKMEPLDSSLAEELSAIRKKKERLRLDKEKTEQILKEREALLDMHTKELLFKGEIQQQLESEVDRLYRLKELKLSCMVRERISPIRSLREKQEQKKTNEKH